MSISKKELQLQLRVQACETSLEYVEKTIGEIKEDIDEIKRTDRARSDKKWETAIIIIGTLLATAAASVLSIFLERVLTPSG